MEQTDFQNLIGIILVSLTAISFGLFVCYKFGPETPKDIKK